MPFVAGRTEARLSTPSGLLGVRAAGDGRGMPMAKVWEDGVPTARSEKSVCDRLPLAFGSVSFSAYFHGLPPFLL